jgi:hypothetical protein
MARREWARKLIDKQPMARGGDSVDGNGAIKLLQAEHARAVRIVKAEIKRVHMDERNYGIADQIIIVTALERVLAALQKGRA